MSFFSGFSLGALTGQTQKRRINAAYDQANGEVRSGYANAEAADRAGTDAGIAEFAPYRQQGEAASRMYGNALGLNGRGAQQEFMTGYQSDPFRQFNEDRTTNALMRQFNARGMGNSGAAALAASRANLERGSEDYQTYLTRLAQMQGQGLGVAGNVAGLRSGLGQRMGQYALGRSNALASNAIGQGSALAANDMTGWNNLMKIGGLGLGAYNTFGGGAKPGGFYNARKWGDTTTTYGA